MNNKRIYINLLVLMMATSVFLLLTSSRLAISAQVWNTPAQSFQQMNVPVQLANGDILIDNFEYYDNPLNHGWRTNEPPYPWWGYGIGYGQIATVPDFEEGSRVLDVFMPASPFLPNIQRFVISRAVFKPETGNSAIGPENAYLSFKVRMPLAIEMFDSLTFSVKGTLSDHSRYTIRFLPVENCPDCTEANYEKNATLISDVDQAVIEVKIGRQYADGTWHTVYVNLNRVISNLLEPITLNTIESVAIEGNRYRLDDINFMKVENITKGEIFRLGNPYLFKVGPLFAQLFTPMQRLIFAEDHTCNIYDVITNPNDIRHIWMKDGVDPNTKDLTIPVLRDPDTRRSTCDHAEDMLRFNAFIGSGGSGSFSPIMLAPLPVDLNDDLPLFLPSYYILLDEFMVTYYNNQLIDCDEYLKTGEWCMEADDECVRRVPHEVGPPHCSEGTYYYPPARVRLIEQALKNAGYQYWPNVAMLQCTPQYLEDLIVTVEVTDGLTRDVETFSLSVTNYPVENYPPIIEDLDNQIGYVGETFKYPLTAIDPDSCLYSITHPKQDQFTLTWKATISNYPNYHYGPWQERLIDPYTGLISITPQFEGNYSIVVTVTDNRGLYSMSNFTLCCANKGGWLNHPPVVFGDWDQPQVCRAGELLFLADEIDVQDPDGDKVYYSCNIGSIGVNAAGKPIWSFQTQYPGFYLVNIVAMDVRGGFTNFFIHVEVRPWWSI